jgi:ABC-type antimicrobial peptide transport system permease subunit
VVNVGLFGVLSYLVATRTRELALRSALGASPRQVVAVVVRQAAAMTAAGTIAGLLVASAGAAGLSRFVFGVAAADPVSFIAAPIGIAVAAMLASLVPARRAAAVDPVRVLRAE